MAKKKPRTCGECRHLEPGGLWGILTYYARDDGTRYPAATSDTALTCPRAEPKPAEAPYGT